MDSSTPQESLDPELLRHAAFVRRLARQLTGNAADAEDCEQEVWLKAATRPPADLTGARSWLARVLRNLVVDRLRREERRRTREGEHAASHAPTWTPTDEADAAILALEHLSRAFVALPEPYRVPLFFRYHRDLSVAEIGRELGLGIETVKARLRRGLELLREDMRVRLGSSDSRPALLVLCGWPDGAASVQPSTHLATFVALMTKKTGITTVLILLAAGLLALLIKLSLFGPAAAPLDGSEVTVIESERGSGLDESQLVPVTTDLERTPAASNAATPAEADGALIAALLVDVPPVNVLSGRVVDGADAPVVGAVVRLQRGELRAFSVLDLELSRSRQRIAESVTDATGEFRFELARGLPVDVHVEAEDFCPALVPDRHAGEFVIVRVSAGFRVFGRVTREDDHAVVADAEVRAFRYGGPTSLERRVRTANNGTYDLRLTHSDRVMLEVVPRVEQSSEWIEVTLDENGEAEVDVRVKVGQIATGMVTSLADGKPIAGATVGEGWVYRRTAMTDADGVYRMTGFGAPGMRELFAKAPGYGQSKIELLPAAVEGVFHIDFQLPPARRAHGRVVDANGEPLRDVLAAAVASGHGPQGQLTDWLSSRTDANGRFEIDRLTTSLRHALVLSQHGFATRVYDFPASEFANDDLDLGTFTLGPPALLAGVVEDGHGVGVPGVEVIAKGSNDDRSRLASSPSRGSEVIGDRYTDARTTHTDGNGRFSFGDAAEGSYTVRARIRGRRDSPGLDVRVAEGEQRDDLVIVMADGASVRGRATDPAGRPVAGVYVSARAVELRDPSKRFESSEPTTSTDAKGLFEFKGLEAGDYRIEVMPWPNPEPDSDTPLLSKAVERVSTGADEVVVVLPRGETIRGTLRDAAGHVLVGYWVNPVQSFGASALITTNESGEFCVPVPAGGTYDLEVRGPSQGRREVLLVEHGIASGAREVELVLP